MFPVHELARAQNRKVDRKINFSEQINIRSKPLIFSMFKSKTENLYNSLRNSQCDKFQQKKLQKDMQSLGNSSNQKILYTQN